MILIVWIAWLKTRTPTRFPQSTCLSTLTLSVRPSPTTTQTWNPKPDRTTRRISRTTPLLLTTSRSNHQTIRVLCLWWRTRQCITSMSPSRWTATRRIKILKLTQMKIELCKSQRLGIWWCRRRGKKVCLQLKRSCMLILRMRRCLRIKAILRRRGPV